MRKKQKKINVFTLLEATYHSPRLGNKKNPLNELLYILLSLRTTGPSFERSYLDFKRVFPKWKDVYDASKEMVSKVIERAGLSNQKAGNLKKILDKLLKDFGKVTLSTLKTLTDSEIETYLCSLPGIGKKSARCIMLYSFDRQVFPVDTHCFRIIKRLGWIDINASYSDKRADEIQEMIPPETRYSAHVNMVVHGRNTCLERFPKCQLCIINKDCEFGIKRLLRGNR